MSDWTIGALVTGLFLGVTLTALWCAGTLVHRESHCHAFVRYQTDTVRVVRENPTCAPILWRAK